MFDSGSRADIDALPAYIDRVVLDEILSRLRASPDQQVDLLRGLKEHMPTEGPSESYDFAIGFWVEGDSELTALFNRLIRWR